MVLNRPRRLGSAIAAGVASVVACAAAAAAAQPPATDVSVEVRRIAGREMPSLEALYRTLHAAPELSLREEHTSARVALELRSAGFDVTERVGGWGVVGVLRNGRGPTVLVRTDMDALPVTEATGLPFASAVRAGDEQGREVGVMHACGHDAHMAIFVGTARVLAGARDGWRGTLVMLAQPAEERGLGAKAMLDDGLFVRFPRPDLCLALHVTPGLPVGVVGVVEGYAFANVDTVEVVMRGTGGHGARPHVTRDPVVMAAEFVMALQTVVSRRMDPVEPAVVTVGSIHGGEVANVIPDEVRLMLTVRSYAPEARRLILAEIARIAKGVAEGADAPADRMPTVRVVQGYTPALYNDPALAARLAGVWRRWLGDAAVAALRPEMIGEDFAAYGLVEPRVPICMFRVGTSSPEALAESRRSGVELPTLHSARYAPAMPGTLATGVIAMSAAALDALAAAR